MKKFNGIILFIIFAEDHFLVFPRSSFYLEFFLPMPNSTMACPIQYFACTAIASAVLHQLAILSSFQSVQYGRVHLAHRPEFSFRLLFIVIYLSWRLNSQYVIWFMVRPQSSYERLSSFNDFFFLITIAIITAIISFTHS